MFQFLSRKQNDSPARVSNQTPHPHVPDYRQAPHYRGKLDQALEYFGTGPGLSDDFIVRIVNVNGVSAACLFINSICDPKVVESVLQSLLTHSFPKKQPKYLVQYVFERVLTTSETLFMSNLFEMKEAVNAGDIVLLIDGVAPGLVIAAQYVEHRVPEQPYVEASSRGSQISFVENIDVNVGLIRKALRSDSLQVKKLKIGYRSRTEVAVVYLVDVANPVAMETVMGRLNAIHIDVISQSSAIEQRIQDNHWTPIPMTRTTQRVDSVIREVNQGKIAIIVDGDPMLLVVPATLMDFFQTEEDYSHTYIEATFIRWLRIVSFVLALFLPSLYIAFVDFNPELLPKLLGAQIARSREGVPFSAFVEVLMMQTVIEILREATLRMPKQMGQTIGIVGGLVLGEASVQAGLVSNILIIVIALTAISVFVTPSYEFSTVIRILNWIMIFAAAGLGLYGITLMSILLLYHVSSLKSFGMSMLDPLNGEHLKDLFIDGLVRMPVILANHRASHLHPQDPTGEVLYDNPVPHPQLEKGPKNAVQSPRRHP